MQPSLRFWSKFQSVENTNQIVSGPPFVTLFSESYFCRQVLHSSSLVVMAALLLFTFHFPNCSHHAHCPRLHDWRPKFLLHMFQHRRQQVSGDFASSCFCLSISSHHYHLLSTIFFFALNITIKPDITLSTSSSQINVSKPPGARPRCSCLTVFAFFYKKGPW